MAITIGYIVHNLNDAAVAKRVEMFQRGGASVILAGFRRGPPRPDVCGVPTLELARTSDARLYQRAIAIFATVARPNAVKRAMQDADVLIARNLESLSVAQRIANGRPVLYECLDIHRTLLDKGFLPRLVQMVEKALVGNVAGIIVSSPAFERNHFRNRFPGAEVRLVENRILIGEGESRTPAPPFLPAGPPWKIGWFGMLRCQRSLRELQSLAARFDGEIEVIIAGKPSEAEFADFAGTVKRAPHMSNLGPYEPSQLTDLYGQCHFAWAIDWFEEGQNSDWLLPNRLYEATTFGTVPIVFDTTETGAWLRAHSAGMRVKDATELPAAFAQLDEKRYLAMRRRLDAIPRKALMDDDEDCRSIVNWLEGFASSQ